MTRLRGQKLSGTLVANTKTTVAEWVAHWLANIAPTAEKPCRATTLTGHAKTARLYITPHVGKVALSKLTVATVQYLHGELRRAGIGTGTIGIAHGVLSSAWQAALAQNLVPFNVCRRAGRPRGDQDKAQALTQEQAGAFLKAAKGGRLHALFVLAVTAGCRQGELLGLKRDDIDLADGTVTISRTLVRSKGRFVENPPKSKRGNRTVRIPALAVEALRDHYRRMMAEGHAGSEYVFCNRQGAALWSSDVTRKALKPILKAANLPPIRFHDLRHTSATLLLANGENAKVVQERMGHANIGITLGTYGHVLPGMDAWAAGKFDTMFGTGTAG